MKLTVLLQVLLNIVFCKGTPLLLKTPGTNQMTWLHIYKVWRRPTFGFQSGNPSFVILHAPFQSQQDVQLASPNQANPYSFRTKQFTGRRTNDGSTFQDHNRKFQQTADNQIQRNQDSFTQNHSWNDGTHKATARLQRKSGQEMTLKRNTVQFPQHKLLSTSKSKFSPVDSFPLHMAKKLKRLLRDPNADEHKVGGINVQRRTLTPYIVKKRLRGLRGKQFNNVSGQMDNVVNKVFVPDVPRVVSEISSQNSEFTTMEKKIYNADTGLHLLLKTTQNNTRDNAGSHSLFTGDIKNKHVEKSVFTTIDIFQKPIAKNREKKHNVSVAAFKNSSGKTNLLRNPFNISKSENLFDQTIIMNKSNNKTISRNFAREEPDKTSVNLLSGERRVDAQIKSKDLFTVPRNDTRNGQSTMMRLITSKVSDSKNKNSPRIENTRRETYENIKTNQRNSFRNEVNKEKSHFVHPGSTNVTDRYLPTKSGHGIEISLDLFESPDVTRVKTNFSGLTNVSSNSKQQESKNVDLISGNSRLGIPIINHNVHKTFFHYPNEKDLDKHKNDTGSFKNSRPANKNNNIRSIAMSSFGYPIHTFNTNDSGTKTTSVFKDNKKDSNIKNGRMDPAKIGPSNSSGNRNVEFGFFKKSGHPNTAAYEATDSIINPVHETNSQVDLFGTFKMNKDTEKDTGIMNLSKLQTNRKKEHLQRKSLHSVESNTKRLPYDYPETFSNQNDPKAFAKSKRTVEDTFGNHNINAVEQISVHENVAKERYGNFAESKTATFWSKNPSFNGTQKIKADDEYVKEKQRVVSQPGIPTRFYVNRSDLNEKNGMIRSNHETSGIVDSLYRQHDITQQFDGRPENQQTDQQNKFVTSTSHNVEYQDVILFNNTTPSGSLGDIDRKEISAIDRTQYAGKVKRPNAFPNPAKYGRIKGTLDLSSDESRNRYGFNSSDKPLKTPLDSDRLILQTNTHNSNDLSSKYDPKPLKGYRNDRNSSRIYEPAITSLVTQKTPYMRYPEKHLVSKQNKKVLQEAKELKLRNISKIVDDFKKFHTEFSENNSTEILSTSQQYYPEIKSQYAEHMDKIYQITSSDLFDRSAQIDNANGQVKFLDFDNKSDRNLQHKNSIYKNKFTARQVTAEESNILTEPFSKNAVSSMSKISDGTHGNTLDTNNIISSESNLRPSLYHSFNIHPPSTIEQSPRWELNRPVSQHESLDLFRDPETLVKENLNKNTDMIENSEKLKLVNSNFTELRSAEYIPPVEQQHYENDAENIHKNSQTNEIPTQQYFKRRKTASKLLSSMTPPHIKSVLASNRDVGLVKQVTLETQNEIIDKDISNNVSKSGHSDSHMLAKKQILKNKNHDLLKQSPHKHRQSINDRNVHISRQSPKQIAKDSQEWLPDKANEQEKIKGERQWNRINKIQNNYKPSRRQRQRSGGFFRWNRQVTRLLIQIKRHYDRMFDYRGINKAKLWRMVEKEFNSYSKRKASLKQLQNKWRELQTFNNFRRHRKRKKSHLYPYSETSTSKPECTTKANNSKENSREVTPSC